VGRFLIIRAFTPIGFLLAAGGLMRGGDGGRLWRVWGLSAAAALAVLSGKLHHEYYWLALAPVAAVGVGQALAEIARRGTPGRFAAALAGTAFVSLSLIQSASTWQTPAMWSALLEAAATVRKTAPAGDLVVAPEALLYYADRRGYRLEYDADAVARVSRELGSDSTASVHGAQAFDLVCDYRDRGVKYFADLIGSFEGPKRRALHEAIRHDHDNALDQRFGVLVDEAGVVLIAGPPRTAPVGDWNPP
jgi:hypothetical protein